MRPIVEEVSGLRNTEIRWNSSTDRPDTARRHVLGGRPQGASVSPQWVPRGRNEKGRGPSSNPAPCLSILLGLLRGLPLRPAPAGRRDHGHADPGQDHRDEPELARVRARER